MPWTNYHSHTHFCDGTDAPDVYLREAEKLSMLAYGYSSHAPVPFDCNWAMKREGLAEYVRQIRALRGTSSVQVYCSLEIDYVPGIMGPCSDLIREVDLDYTLASVHFVDFLEEDRPWEIDGMHTVFMEGLKRIFQGDVRAAIERYYSIIRQMVVEDCPQVIGHLDKIKMQNRWESIWEEDSDWYRMAVMETLETIAASKAIVEVNTRGMYKKVSPHPYPSPWILREIRKMGIPIMLNSDCHHPSEIIAEFGLAADLLQSLGFRELMVFLDNQWQALPFDTQGY